MKTYTFLLIVIIAIVCMTNKSYSAKDTLPPRPVCIFCSCCGGTHDDAFVEDMPQTYERSRLDTIILHKESFNYDFSYKEFRPGIDFKTKWYAEVHDYRKDAYIKITFIDYAGNDTTIQHHFYSTKIAIRPDLDFGLLSFGESKELDCWIINEATFADTVIGLMFKSYYPEFEILGLNLPIILPAGDSLKFKVRFTAYFSDDFKDSIGYRTYCAEDYVSEVKAIVGSPRIDVTNYDFGIRDVNSSTNCSILIWNQGITNLVITGYKGPKQPSVFIPYFNDINENNPLVIQPKEVFSCEVVFIPPDENIYTDTIFFISNTEKCGNPDSVAELTGRGISYPIINVSDAYFGNVIQNNSVIKNITVENIGLKELIISSYDKPQNSMFIHKFDREINPANPLILQPSESWNFEVEFYSQNVCDRIQQNYIIFHSNAKKGDSTAFFRVDSVLLGVGDGLMNEDNVILNPNPADDFLTISFYDDSRKSGFIKLFDSFGNVVYENRNIVESNLKIRTSEIASGMYFLKIGNGCVRKVLVVH